MLFNEHLSYNPCKKKGLSFDARSSYIFKCEKSGSSVTCKLLSHYICLVVQVGEGEKRGEERSSSEYGLKDMFHPTLRYIREPSLKYKINK